MLHSKHYRFLMCQIRFAPFDSQHSPPEMIFKSYHKSLKSKSFDYQTHLIFCLPICIRDNIIVRGFTVANKESVSVYHDRIRRNESMLIECWTLITNKKKKVRYERLDLSIAETPSQWFKLLAGYRRVPSYNVA